MLTNMGRCARQRPALTIENMKFKTTLLAIAAISACGAVSSQGAVLFANNIDGTNPSSTNPFTAGQTVIDGVTALGIGRGAGLNANAGADRFNANGFAATLTAAITGNDFFTFTLTPTAGNSISFTNLVFNGQRSSSGPTTFSIRSSVDSFATEIDSSTVAGKTVDLSGATFQNRTVATEFRFFGFGATATTGTGSINDFTFNGSVVPEPSTALLGALGMLGLLRRRR